MLCSGFTSKLEDPEELITVVVREADAVGDGEAERSDGEVDDAERQHHVVGPATFRRPPIDPFVRPCIHPSTLLELRGAHADERSRRRRSFPDGRSGNQPARASRFEVRAPG
jgi:hypothetical protein